MRIKTIASNSVSAGDSCPRTREVLHDHVSPSHEYAGDARIARKTESEDGDMGAVHSLGRQSFAAVGARQVLVGTERYDAGRIDIVMGDVIVPLDMVEVDGVGDAVGLIEVFQVAEEVWVIDDSPEVALEMAMIDGVEAHEGDEQAPIGFDEL